MNMMAQLSNDNLHFHGMIIIGKKMSMESAMQKSKGRVLGKQTA
jgi:hypothetical protein